MQTLLYLHSDKIVLFGMVLARIAAMVMTAPIFGSRSIPFHIRILIAIVLAVLVAPLQWHLGIDTPANGAECLVGLVVNILIGASLGLAFVILFSGLNIAGSLITQTGTITPEGAVADDLSPASPVAVRLLQLMALTIFVAIGGHRLLMAAILDSFQALPATGNLLPGSMLDTITSLIGESFRMAIRIAAPVITALLAATLLVGLTSRAIPQLNSFTIGFTVNLWATFIALLCSLAAIGYLFEDQIHAFLSIWQQTF
jgi:flagellar biosynthetic protein FliR